jgi:hypothetical protein
MVGAIGFFLGFTAWLFWLLLVISARVFGYGFSNYMSGIFFQNWVFYQIFRSLISFSFAFESFGFFALRQKYGSDLAFACGMLFLAISVLLILSLIIPLQLRFLPWFIGYNPTTVVNVGLLVSGVTFLLIRKSLPTPRKALGIGLAFIIISALTLTLFKNVLLYWGFEMWLMYFGWLFAISSLAAGQTMIHVRSISHACVK